MRDNKMTRREFMALSGGAIVQIGLPGTFIKLSCAQAAELESQTRPDGRLKIPPNQIIVKSIEDMGGREGPGLHPGWQLKISGEVEMPGALGWEEIMQLPQTDLVCDIHCVTGWTLLDSKWQGILLKHLMNHVKVTKKAAFVIFDAHAGYTTSIPIKEARKDNVLLAHSFSGKPLPEAHGAPLRGLVPDRYLYKSAKWLEGIRFSSSDELGYWEKTGYSNSADPWKEERED